MDTASFFGSMKKTSPLLVEFKNYSDWVKAREKRAQQLQPIQDCLYEIRGEAGTLCIDDDAFSIRLDTGIIDKQGYWDELVRDHGPPTINTDPGPPPYNGYQYEYNYWKETKLFVDFQKNQLILGREGWGKTIAPSRHSSQKPQKYSTNGILARGDGIIPCLINHYRNML